MKFYEFYEYEYYALILAEDEETAILGYEENVAEIYEDEKDLTPTVITIDKALERFLKAKIDNCKTEKDKTVEFYRQVNDFISGENVERYQLFLIDGSLF